MVGLFCVLLSVFYTSLFGVLLFSNTISCCLFLLLGLVSLCGFVWLSVGFSWYLVVFCLVYVGGVFVLLVYISLYNSNHNAWFVGNWGLVVGFMVSVLLFLNGLCGLGWLGWDESGHYLCLFENGFSYCSFSIVLLISFSLISFFFSSKESYFR